MALEKAEDMKTVVKISTISGSSISPVTDLTKTLSSLSSLSSQNDTPRTKSTPDSGAYTIRSIQLHGELDSDSPFNSPMIQERVLKEIKVDNNNNRSKQEKTGNILLQKRISRRCIKGSSFCSQTSIDSQDSGYSERRRVISMFKSYASDGPYINGVCPGSDEDDGFSIFGDEFEENTQMPSTFTTLLTKPLTTHSTESVGKENSEAKYHQKQANDQECCCPPLQIGCKRAESQELFNSVKCKRWKGTLLRSATETQNLTFSNKNSATCCISRHKTESIISRTTVLNEAAIMNAVQRAMQEPDLIGDFSKPYALPLANGTHTDLKEVSPDTVAHLLQGQYNNIIKSYCIIDCRYPYEYSAGHIKGAENIFTKEDVYCKFLAGQKNQVENSERNIIVFHCEFSSERGPKLCRYLRNEDREMNRNVYPYLHYPEVYMLNGGYKAFYQSHKELCEPPNYKPMLHKDHEKELRHFRSKSRSAGGEKRLATRSGSVF